jgi:FkbM family methyltransferase
MMFNSKTYTIRGTKITLLDNKQIFYAKEFIIKELQFDLYNFNNINLSGGVTDNHVLIDLGGNMGTLAIYLALKYPNLKIYSYEADPENFAIYQENIKLNNLQDHENLKAFNLAVTKDGKDVYINKAYQSGANKISSTKANTSHIVKSITLDDIIQTHNIKAINYLKVDIEGSEFDVIYASESFKNIPIEYYGGEVHGTREENTKLISYIKQYVNPNLVYIEEINNRKIITFIGKIVAKYYTFCYPFSFLRAFNFFILFYIIQIVMKFIRK